MKDSEIERLSMNARIKVIGGLETVRQELSKLLGKRGTLESLYEFLSWAGTVFEEAKVEITKAIGEAEVRKYCGNKWCEDCTDFEEEKID